MYVDPTAESIILEDLYQNCNIGSMMPFGSDCKTLYNSPVWVLDPNGSHDFKMAHIIRDENHNGSDPTKLWIP